MSDQATTPGLLAQIEAMNRLDFMLGQWRGVGWTMTKQGRVEFEQEESVRRMLSGEIVMVEGRANAPGDRDDVRFSAFAIARYDGQAGAYWWRTYSAGNCVEVPLEVGEGTYRWELEPGPNVRMRFDGTLTRQTWAGTGSVSVDAGRSWSRTLEMNLTRVDDGNRQRVRSVSS